MNNEMKIMGRMLIANEQGRNLASLNVVPKQSKHIRNLAALVVHTGVVFTSKMGNMLLLPFINMLQNPAKLNVMSVIYVILFIEMIFLIERFFAYNARGFSL